jgi:hypothetical protein
MVGVEALSVEPSAAAPPSVCVVEDGDAGFVVDLLQATAVASTPAAVQTRTFRIMR